MPGFDPLGDLAAEYAAARDGAAVFDLSANGKLELTGPEAPQFLHNLSTNDVNSLPLGGGCEAFFCDSRAKVLAFARIYHVLRGGDHALWVDTEAGQGNALLAHLDRHLIAERVEITDRTAEFAQLHLAGPAAKATLDRAFAQPLPDLALHQHMERTLGRDATVHVRRHDLLGVPGYDMVARADKMAVVWHTLMAFGAVPAGAETYELLRVEAGTPVYGRDMDAKRFVVEVCRADAISYTKGCYLGQEPIVMARDRAGFVNRSFRGVRLSAPASAGDPLFGDGGKDVGVLTSVAISPQLGPIALAYLKRGNETPGTSVAVGAEGAMATVAALPFAPPTA